MADRVTGTRWAIVDGEATLAESDSEPSIFLEACCLCGELPEVVDRAVVLDRSTGITRRVREINEKVRSGEIPIGIRLTEKGWALLREIEAADDRSADA